MTYADSLRYLHELGSLPSGPQRPPKKKGNQRIYDIMDKYGNSCIYCGSRERITIDHYVARSLGGDGRMENLVPACEPCNNAKGNLLPLDFVLARLNAPVIAATEKMKPLPASAGYLC